MAQDVLQFPAREHSVSVATIDAEVLALLEKHSMDSIILSLFIQARTLEEKNLILPACSPILFDNKS